MTLAANRHHSCLILCCGWRHLLGWFMAQNNDINRAWSIASYEFDIECCDGVAKTTTNDTHTYRHRQFSSVIYWCENSQRLLSQWCVNIFAEVDVCATRPPISMAARRNLRYWCRLIMKCVAEWLAHGQRPDAQAAETPTKWCQSKQRCRRVIYWFWPYKNRKKKN